MTKILIGGAAAAALLAITPALAQTPAPAAAQPHAGGQMMARAHTRADVAAHVQAMFARIDANRDGFVTKAEAEAMRGKRHEKMGDHHAKAFERLDANRDGSISRGEWDAHAAQRQQRGAMHGGDGDGDKRSGHHGGDMGKSGKSGMSGRMFDMADANRDARVSMAEATAAALSHFDMADTNRDGQLTRDERMQMHHKMRGTKQPS